MEKFFGTQLNIILGFFDNFEVIVYVESLLVFLMIVLCFNLIRLLILQKSNWQIELIGKFHNIVKYIITKIKTPLIVIIAFYISTLNLDLSDQFKNILGKIFQAALILQIILITQEIIKLYFDHFSDNKHKNQKELRALYGYLSRFIIIALWLIGILMVLSNIGYDISSLIASLGIGGIAVALAVQGILRDIFSGFTILVSKPFQVGDFIKVGEKGDSGTVESIGFKNTIIKMIGAESMIVPNNDILNAKIYNFTSRKKRRVNFKLYIDLNTNSKELQKFKEEIIEIIKKEKLTQDDPLRVLFADFNEFSIVLDIVYLMHNNDFEDYIYTKDSINFQIKKSAEKLGIKFSNMSPQIS